MKRLSLNLTSVIVMLAVGVLLPVLLSTAVGIVAICIAEDTGGIVTGVLVISFTATAAGCGFLALVFIGKKARLARQQADFIANISHELRTPLSAIRLYAQTLQSGNVDNDPVSASRCIATILRETTCLEVMIDSILTWRASSKDVMELKMKTLPLSASVHGAVDMFRSMVPLDEIDLSVSIDTVLPVRHDKKALTAVVLNLLVNAYKYTGIDKSVSVTAFDSENEVVVEVKDNGIGIPQSEVKKIFQPFYRVKRRDAGETAGVGLGLAIVWQLVDMHKGTVTVSSEEGKGSSFKIRLPSA